MKKSVKLVSVAMKFQTSKLEKKFGDLEKKFWSEDKSKYYSSVDLRCSILGNVASVLKSGRVEMR